MNDSAEPDQGWILLLWRLMTDWFDKLIIAIGIITVIIFVLVVV